MYLLFVFIVVAGAQHPLTDTVAFAQRTDCERVRQEFVVRAAARTDVLQFAAVCAPLLEAGGL
jgi:hypothetical protein